MSILTLILASIPLSTLVTAIFLTIGFGCAAYFMFRGNVKIF